MARLSRLVRAEIAAIVAVFALVVIVAFPSTGVGGVVRTVLALFAMIVIPGWILVSHAEESGSWFVRVFGGIVVSVCAYVIFGFVGYELGYRATAVVYLVPAVVVGVVLILWLGGSRRPGVDLTAVGMAVAFSAAALVGAWVTHLSLPAVPVEPAFSIESAVTTAATAGHDVIFDLSVERVKTTTPNKVSVFVNGTYVLTLTVPSDTTSVTFDARVPGSHPDACTTRVLLRTPNGSFLTPRVACTDNGPPKTH